MRTVPFRTRFSLAAGTVAIALFVTTMACGGSNSPTSPSGGGTTQIVASTGTTGASGATITMTSGGINPASVTIAVGQSVTFVNNDTKSHEIASDPHPIHGSCPSIENGLGTIAAGQTKLTQGFAGAGTCTFHDHLDNTNRAFQGTIRVQ